MNVDAEYYKHLMDNGNDTEIIYREAYTEGYQRAVKDYVVYKFTKTQVKQFSITELNKWKRFEDEYYQELCKPPTPHSITNDVSTQKNRINNLKYVYVIKGSRVSPTESHYKIGITNNINNRIETLQTSCPDKLELLFKHRTIEAYKLEKSLHIYFKYYRIRSNGEWFKFDDEKISEWLRTEFQDFVSLLGYPDQTLTTPPK